MLIRLTPALYDRLVVIAENVGGGMATTCRAILEQALSEGVNVVNSSSAKRAKRARREDAQASA